VVGTGSAREPVLVGPDSVTLRARIEVVGAVAVDHGDTFLRGWSLGSATSSGVVRTASAAANAVVAGACTLRPGWVDKIRQAVCVKKGR